MKQISLALLGVLAALHLLEGGDATATPLSMFRDGQHAWLGYTAFALLILMGVVVAHGAYRCGEFATSIFYSVAMIILFAIAATPAFDPLHLLLSLLLPLMLYGYYLQHLYSELNSRL